MKYKIGELVELSAAGQKNQCNRVVLGLIGMVLQKTPEGIEGFPYKVQWFGFTGSTHDGIGIVPMKEYEIKRVRAPR
jgi:hypothetical protein